MDDIDTILLIANMIADTLTTKANFTCIFKIYHICILVSLALLLITDIRLSFLIGLPRLNKGLLLDKQD